MNEYLDFFLTMIMGIIAWEIGKWLSHIL